MPRPTQPGWAPTTREPPTPSGAEPRPAPQDPAHRAPFGETSKQAATRPENNQPPSPMRDHPPQGQMGTGGHTPGKKLAHDRVRQPPHATPHSQGAPQATPCPAPDTGLPRPGTEEVSSPTPRRPGQQRWNTQHPPLTPNPRVPTHEKIRCPRNRQGTLQSQTHNPDPEPQRTWTAREHGNTRPAPSPHHNGWTTPSRQTKEQEKGKASK
ncbi:uncharacterized protein LOC129185267 [Dunckerocampus dactyliophorus]|uniref:uncharacterized protein LOC129185267 n=1 Tax=Dunckerocampus dactyliophorus TaxID=161453 RepID=UPI002404D9CD|nr:uncharacterized protein LOC129185267 [Dunckerocampus dactyliophorus]